MSYLAISWLSSDVTFALVHARRIIRLNSPNLNYLMISGSIMIFVSDFFFVIPTIDSAFMVATCIVS